MIHVQIASQMTAQGLAGVRWVLVETADTPSAGGPAPAQAPVATALRPAGAKIQAPVDTGPPDGGSASSLRLGALKLLVVTLGLAAALWTAHVQVGPPGSATPGPAPERVPAVPALSVPTRPGAMPLAPADPQTAPPAATPARPGNADPAAPAASAIPPRLTAAL